MPIIQQEKTGLTALLIVYAGLPECKYSKTCVKWPLSKRPKIDFQDQGEYSAILSTFIKLPLVIKFFVMSIFEWSFFTGLTVCTILGNKCGSLVCEHDFS